MSLHTYDPDDFIRFGQWLEANGYEILPTTSQWEMIRFRAGDEVRIIYANKHGSLSHVRQSHFQWEAFHKNKQLPNVKQRATVVEKPDLLQQSAETIAREIMGTHTDHRWKLYEAVAALLVNGNQNFQASHFRALAKAEKG